MEITELFREQARQAEWADALVLAAVIGNPEAGRDEIILAKLRHQHLVQQAFLNFWQGLPIDPNLTRSLEIEALARFARQVHGETSRYHETVCEADLDRIVDMPSKKMIAERLGFEPGDPSLAQTFLQVFSHSAYHRGQVSARLRELGVEPPMTDFIVWIWGCK